MERNVKTVHLESALDGVDLYSLKVFPGSPIAKRVQEEGNWSEASETYNLDFSLLKITTFTSTA